MTDTSLLSSLHLPEDIPGLSLSQKQELAQELRDTIIRVVTNNGGLWLPRWEWWNSPLPCSPALMPPAIPSCGTSAIRATPGKFSPAAPTASTLCAATAAFRLSQPFGKPLRLLRRGPRLHVHFRGPRHGRGARSARRQGTRGRRHRRRRALRRHGP